MGKFMGIFGRSGSEICVFAETRREAQKIALDHFIAKLEKELKIVELSARTERCDICQYTYPSSEIVRENDEKICGFCYFDKYQFEEQNLNDTDIPF